MAEANSSLKENSQQNNSIYDNFDYSKICDDMDSITNSLEQLSKETVKMRVECSFANIELASKIDSMDVKNKIQELEKAYEACLNSIKNNNETE
ncbi:hypothetical protein X975_16026, partial [Stegodyphus mimosarum]